MSYSTHLRILEASGLVSLVNVLPEVEYLFRHTLIQEAAYDSLLKSDRQSLHMLTGSVLEEIYQEREEEVAPVLARHFHAAGDDERALKYFTLSGDRAMAVYAIPEAIEHYKFALDIAKQKPSGQPRLERLFTQLGSAFELNAQYELALENYREMESVAIENSDDALKLAAIISRAKVYATPSAVHDARKVQELSAQALELATDTDNKAAQARIHWILSLVYARTGRYLESIVHGEDALDLARELNLKELVAYTQHDMIYSYLSTFQFEKGYQAITESQSLWRKMGNLVMLADSLSTKITYDYFSGNYDLALKGYEEASALSESIGNLWGQAYCRMYIGDLYFDRGHPGEGINIMQKCVDLSKQAGFIVPLLVTQADMGFAIAYLGDSKRGLQIIMTALENNAQAISGWDGWTLAMKARVHILRNELDETRSSLRAAQTAISQGSPAFVPIYLQAIECELALSEKDYTRALELSHLFEDDVLTNMRQYLPWLFYMRGRAFHGTGQLQEARNALTKALEEAEGMQMRHMIWRIQAALAVVADIQGELDLARQLRVQAKDTISYIAERTGSEQLRTSFLNRPDIAAIMESE